MNFLAVKHNLYRTLRANKLDGAIPILEAFFGDYVREISYQKFNTEMEVRQRAHGGCTEEMRNFDEYVVVCRVAAAIRPLVTLKREGAVAPCFGERTVGTLFLLTDGRENGHS